MINMQLEIPSIGGGASFFHNGFDSQLKFETGTTLNIIKSTQILNPDLAENRLGMYTFGDVGRDGEARFGSFSTSKHMLRSRDASCTWNPNGTLTFNVESIPTCPKQYQNEMCASVLWDTCWEKLLDIGMKKYDFNSTPEGAKFLELALNEIISGIHNDYYNVVNFTNHPNITLSDANDYWTQVGVPASDWTSFKSQQLDSRCSGIWTTAEMIKTTDGYDHFNVEIKASDVNGTSYIGDAVELFERAIGKMTPELATWTNRIGIDPDISMPIIHVSQGIFNKYKAQLQSQFTAIPATMQLYLMGEKGLGMPYRNVLMYNGYWVVARPDWHSFDRITGVTTHAIAITAPGVLGVAFDVSPLKKNGMGLVVTHRPDAPFNKTYFETQFRVGGLILDHRFMVYGSLFLEPAV